MNCYTLSRLPTFVLALSAGVLFQGILFALFMLLMGMDEHTVSTATILLFFWHLPGCLLCNVLIGDVEPATFLNYLAYCLLCLPGMCVLALVFYWPIRRWKALSKRMTHQEAVNIST